jgi:hypothetical protein
MEMLEDVLVKKLASNLHEQWRAQHEINNPIIHVPELKITQDKKFIEKYGADSVDIANISYEELPEDLRVENQAAAMEVAKLVLEGIGKKKNLDEKLIEEISAKVHSKWLERNVDLASSEQKRPYSELGENEKEKDRSQVRMAISIYESLKSDVM